MKTLPLQYWRCIIACATLFALTLSPTTWAQTLYVDQSLALSGDFYLRFDTYTGTLPIPDDGVSDAIQQFRRQELPDGSADVGIRQITRLHGTASPGHNASLHFTLRNYGYWGVGYYTSGSYGIRAFTADPFSLEELSFSLPAFSGQLTIGSQYFQLGPIGLLSATPSNEQEGIAVPLHAVLWQRDMDRNNFTAVGARLTVLSDDDGNVIGTDDYAAFRHEWKPNDVIYGTNVLAAGVHKQRGISWDVYFPHAAALEVAVAQDHPEDNAQVAVYGQLPIIASTMHTFMGYVDERFPLLYTQIGDRGGLTPLQQGRGVIGVSVDHHIQPSSLLFGDMRYYTKQGTYYQWQTRIGLEHQLTPNSVLHTEWTGWFGDTSAYSRWRTTLHVAF